MRSKIMSSLLAALIIVSCGQQNTKVTTASGLEIQYAKKNDGKEKKQGDIVFLNMKYTTDTDSVMLDTKERGSMPMPYDSAQWKSAGAIYEAFDLLTQGDSITFSISAEELFVNTFKTEVPPEIKKGSNLKFYIGVEKILSEEDYLAEQKSQFAGQFEQQFQSRISAIKQSAAEQLKIDGDILDKYFSKNNIEAQTTESGLRYVITQEGTGPKAAAGDMLETHYHGTLLDGTKFDSSYDRGQPFPFRLREGRVILGWDEGFGLLNVGAKATLYIPSSLAYGGGGQGVITANSILKFDVELLGIK